MNIYLKHERHGTKIATLEMEAEFDEAHGWVRYNPDDTDVDDDAEDFYIEPAETSNALQSKRRGRPPKNAT